MNSKEETVSMKEILCLTFRTISDINRFSPGYMPSMILNGIFSAVSPFVTVYLSALLINELAGSRRPEEIWKLVAITVSVTSLLALIDYLLRRWTADWQEKFNIQSIQFLTSKMLDLDYADMDQQSTWDLYKRICQACNWDGFGYYKLIDGINKIVRGFSGVFSSVALTVSLFTLPVPDSAGKLTILNNPMFLLVFILVLGMITLFSFNASSYQTKVYMKGADLALFENRLFTTIGSYGLNGSSYRSTDIRMYNQHNIAQNTFMREKTYTLDGLYGYMAYGMPGILQAVSGACGAILTGAAYVFVCLKAAGGAFGIGSVTQYVSALTALTGNISLILISFDLFRINTPHLRRMYEYLDIPNSMYQGSLPTEKRDDREYDVEFKDVSFKYPGSDLWALRHVNMKFKVGKRLAIVGENGSGKTTFIKLLCRLYGPQEGQILLNGIDIRKYNYRDYMNVFSIVFQDFQLLSQPLGNNVAGASEYDVDRATRALVDAGFGDRLAELPDGLATMLYKDFGKNGIDISGGEAQKIAIARALYKDAPFIILDEPTASLDPIAEAEIYAKFNDISGDKTAIYISHRLSSCKFCDEIAVFHEGAVIQQGTHAELVADENGKYHELWNAQAQYYTEKSS